MSKFLNQGFVYAPIVKAKYLLSYPRPYACIRGLDKSTPLL